MKKTPSVISSYKKPLFVISAVLLLSFTVTVFVRAYTLRRPLPQEPLSQSQKQSLEAVLNQAYPERTAVLRPLPYPVNPAVLDVRARSAIAVNMQNGCVLYEKNADEIIPPASMTKLFVMYVVFEEIKKGTVSLKDTVPLPPECWACNMPPHSSLMFLGKNQIVTLEELLTGLAVCSGNDAAYAVADYICGEMEAFIGRMNAAAENL
ncbi:MAG: serine hydrolase, partial [Treponema porcinum]|uniref:D-alanyl-D-alanine carboxypeptidase family protein n=1 Tax=Treponema porcinum TaxID=261392 RepID=UPI002A8284DC